MTVPQSTEASPLELDAVVVGAGFAGIYLLQRLRDDLHLNVKVLEAGSSVGGVWHFNTYPGARVDVATPYYGFGFDKTMKSWSWPEKYASQKDMNAYFQHVSETMSISKDCIFNTRVKSAEFDVQKGRWNLKTENGLTVVAKYFIPAVGFSSVPYVPSWKGLESFQGPICHSAEWPKGGIDVRGKRVAVLGTGSSGVQIIQQWAKEAGELFVFQRTPNLAIPMGQTAFDSATQEERKKKAADIFDKFRETCGSQMPWEMSTKSFVDQSPEEWEKVLDERYKEGGFGFCPYSMADIFTSPEGNRFVYDFWAKKTRERINDPVKRDLLAPLDPPHPFGTKRPSLENDYYEQFNRPNVHIVNTKEDPIAEITPHSIITQSGASFEVDAIAICTGFDATTASLMNLGIRDTNGVNLRERWRGGVLSFLGVMIPGFPNMFVVYGAQSPAAFSNGPMLIEVQADWIRDMIGKFQKMGNRFMDARSEPAQAWKEEVLAIANATLIPQAKSWWTGANVPGKKVEILYYLGGLSMYKEKCYAALGSNFATSFTVY